MSRRGYGKGTGIGGSGGARRIISGRPQSTGAHRWSWKKAQRLHAAIDAWLPIIESMTLHEMEQFEEHMPQGCVVFKLHDAFASKKLMTAFYSRMGRLREEGE